MSCSTIMRLLHATPADDGAPATVAQPDARIQDITGDSVSHTMRVATDPPVKWTLSRF